MIMCASHVVHDCSSTLQNSQDAIIHFVERNFPTGAWRRRLVDRRNISGPKRAHNAISLSTCFFLHNSTHMQTRHLNPVKTVRVEVAPSQLHERSPAGGLGDVTPCLDGRLHSTLSLRAIRLACDPYTTMCWPSSPPLSAKRARTSDTYWRPSKNGMRCCKSLSVGSFIQPCIGIALS